MQPPSSRVIWDMLDGPMPRGLFGVGSGDAQLIDGRWTLFLGGYSTSFRNRLYVATAPRDTDPATADWSIRVDGRGRARALLPDPPRSAWDGGGLHTPSYVPAVDGHPPRLYYAGRRGRRHVGAGSGYAVGVLEHVGGKWQRRDHPILEGSGPRGSVLEPLVVHYDGRYVLWYLATPHEVAPGEQPDYELRSTVSDDGVTGWSDPEVFTTAEEGYFDNAIARTSEGWVMLLARGTNLHGTVPFPPQGLWAMTAAVPSARRSDWAPPVQLIDTDQPGTPEWMAAGMCDPALIVNADGSATAFVTGTRATPPWPRLLLSRMARGKRPPVPAPFYLAAGSVRLDLRESGVDAP